MSSPIDLTAGSMRWRVLPACREQLLGPRGLRLDEWLAAGQARVVKHAPHRTVYEVRLPGLHFYLKHNRLTGARSWLREWLRPGKALAEFERAVAVAARGIPTFEPLAAGEPCRSSGDSFLLTRALEDTQPLGVFLQQEPPARLRQRIADTLGRLLADMHDAGAIHHDLHPGNLLLALDADDQPRLYLIDLHAVHLGPRLGWSASRANLVVLNRWFILRASRPDRLRAWRAYHSRRAERCPDRPREVEERTVASNLDFWRALEGRCLGDNRRFRRVRSALGAGHAVTDLDRVALDALLADPDEPFRRPGVRLLKDSRSSTVADMEFPVGGVSQRVIYKRFRITSKADPWLALFRQTAALRSWENGHGLRLRWLPTPRPLAVFHRRRNGLRHEGYLLTTKLQGAEDLHEFVARTQQLPAAERRTERLAVLERVARLVRDMHVRGVSHRDLKAVNVLVVREPQPSSGEPLDHWPHTSACVWLIDLVGVRRYRRLGRRRKVQNLARLHASFVRSPAASRSDKLRFLRLYLQCGLRDGVDWKDWWRHIDMATRAKVARNARSGRPLA